jgi:hypothetical protein
MGVMRMAVRVMRMIPVAVPGTMKIVPVAVMVKNVPTEEVRKW